MNTLAPTSQLIITHPSTLDNSVGESFAHNVEHAETRPQADL